MKIRLVGADGRTDRQTGTHDEANSRFSQFYEKRLKRLAARRCASFPLGAEN